MAKREKNVIQNKANSNSSAHFFCPFSTFIEFLLTNFLFNFGRRRVKLASLLQL